VQQRPDASNEDLPERPAGDLYCRIPQDSPLNVRGARNIPCETKPGKRAPTVKMCESDEEYVPLNDGMNWKGDPNATLSGQDIPQLARGTSAAAGPTVPPPSWSPSPPPASVAWYDPATGTYLGPDGRPYTQGNLAHGATHNRSWQSMLTPQETKMISPQHRSRTGPKDWLALRRASQHLKHLARSRHPRTADTAEDSPEPPLDSTPHDDAEDLTSASEADETETHVDEPTDTDAEAVENFETTTVDEEQRGNSSGRKANSNLRRALAFGLAAAGAVAALAGWWGYQDYQSRLADARHNLFLHVGRQAAVNLTSINCTEVDADLRRIVDGATGPFRDDFSQRAPAFAKFVKEVQSASQGSVVEAAVESEQSDQAQVLVAVTVKTSTAAAPDQQPRYCECASACRRFSDAAKVTSVVFVP